MSRFVDATLFAFGGVVILLSLWQAIRLTPRLRRTAWPWWRTLLLLMGLFVLGYAGALVLVLQNMLPLLTRVTSVVFAAGALYVFFTVHLSDRLNRHLLRLRDQLEQRVTERTAELAEANARLDVALRKAEAANEAQAQFVANMSHEVRTPLTAILGYADLLRQGAPKDPGDLAAAHQAIRRNGQHLLALVDDILDTTKLQAGEIAVERLRCSPLAVTQDVESVMRPAALDRGLEFTIELDGEIPREIRTDPVRLRQVLLNLVGNAVKFTERGGVRIVLSLARTPEPALRWHVHDTGPGIRPEDRERLFRPFQQVDGSTRRERTGSGLGLAISRALARKLGGDVSCDTTDRSGSTFTVQVSTGRLDDVEMITGAWADVATRSRSVDESELSDQRLDGRVLVAEDGADNQRLLRIILERLGLEVVTAPDGEAAIAAALDDGRFDVILMDIQMPRLDGSEATRRLREAGWTGPIIALTAHAMSGDRERCLAAGCDGYLTKPLDVPALVGVLAAHLSPAGTAPVRPADEDLEETRRRLRDLARGFVKRLPTTAADLERAWQERNLSDLEHLAHGLSGAGGTHGHPEISQAAEALEQLLRSSHPSADDIGDAVARLSTACHGAAAAKSR